MHLLYTFPFFASILQLNILDKIFETQNLTTVTVIFEEESNEICTYLIKKFPHINWFLININNVSQIVKIQIQQPSQFAINI